MRIIGALPFISAVCGFPLTPPPIIRHAPSPQIPLQSEMKLPATSALLSKDLLKVIEQNQQGRVSESATIKPVSVGPESFAVGQFWVWEYRDTQERIIAWERYVVEYSDESEIELRLETKFPGENSFKKHHRMTVDLNDCLAAHRNIHAKAQWRLKRFIYDDGDKVIPSGDGRNTQAFTEKFNCLSEADPESVQYEIKWQMMDSTPNEVSGKSFPYVNVKSKFLEKGQSASWYHLLGPNAGVMGHKTLHDGKSGEINAHIKLVDTGSL